nr:hypothetical protein [Tanacetum cinerariifolium]
VSHNNTKQTTIFYKLQEENENVGINGDAIYGKLVLAECYSSDIIWMLGNVDEGDYLKKAAKKVNQGTSGAASPMYKFDMILYAFDCRI